MEASNTILAALENHLERTFEMWNEQIGHVPEDLWRTGDVDHLIPARHLCHVVVSADFYTGTTPLDQFNWNKFFDGDWEDMSPDKLPNKETSLQKLAEVRTIVCDRLAALNDDALLAAETLFPWTGPTLLDRMLYLLRHCQHHLGVLNAELRRRDIKRARWR